MPAYRPRQAKDNLRAAIFLLAALSAGTFFGYRTATTFARFESAYIPLALNNDPIVHINRTRAGAECELKSGATLTMLYFKDARSGYGGYVDEKIYVGDKFSKKPNQLELFINGELAIDGKSYMASRPVDIGGGGWGILSVISGVMAGALLTTYLIYFEIRPRMARARDRAS